MCATVAWCSDCVTGDRDTVDKPTRVRFIEDATGCAEFKERANAWTSKFSRPTPLANMTQDDIVAQACLNIGAVPPELPGDDQSDPDWVQPDSKADRKHADTKYERKRETHGALNSNSKLALQNITKKPVVSSLLIGNKHDNEYVMFFVFLSLFCWRVHCIDVSVVVLSERHGMKLGIEQRTTRSLVSVEIGASRICKILMNALWLIATVTCIQSNLVIAAAF